MLERLSSIGWSHIEAANGSAAGFAWALQALSTDSGETDRAIETLSEAVCDQCGSISEAAVAATPFLIELLAEPQVTNKQAVLELLLHYRSPEAVPFFAVGDSESQVTLTRRLDEAIGSGVPIYLALLEDEDVPARLLAIQLLAGIPARAAEIERSLAAHLQTEPQPVFKAALVMALGCLGAERYQGLFREQFETAREPGVRIVAGFRLAHVMKADTPPEVQAALLANFPAFQEAVLADLTPPPPLPFGASPSVALIVKIGLLAASWFDPALVREALARLADQLEPPQWISDLMLEVLLSMTFRDTGFRAPPAEQLTPLQLRAVRIVARAAFQLNVTDYQRLNVAQRFGLPTDRAGLYRYARLVETSGGEHSGAWARQSHPSVSEDTQPKPKKWWEFRKCASRADRLRRK